MKTIILASSEECLIFNNIDDFLPKPLNESRILYITTASKKVNNPSYVKKTREKISEICLSYTEIDIVGKTKEELIKALSLCDIVYVEGGNTFYLLKAVRDSGFDKIIKKAIDNGLVYWGVSAGSYIACPSIVMATWSKDFDRCGITDLSAMNLVPFLIKAHYTPDNLELLKEEANNLQLPIRVLNDQQAVLIRDEDVQLIGEGEEIIL